MVQEHTASDGEKGPDTGGGEVSPKLEVFMNSQYLVVQERTASDGERGPDTDGGQVSQYLVNKELTASDGEKGPDRGGQAKRSLEDSGKL